MNLPGAVACTKCGEPVSWVSTGQRQMPLDPEPNVDGNAFVAYEDGHLIVKVRSKRDPRPRGVAFMPHFATCAAINRGRKPKKVQPCPPKPENPPTLFDSV